MKFGKLFRKLRQALGISLREFCRRNNLDAANISRLERGLVRPPQSPTILEAYAAALSISRESVQWHIFFELAALENGMVSPQIQESQIMRENLPKVFQKLREETKHLDSWVKARDLVMWADSYGASFTLPRLIRRLVRATVKNCIRVEFPADEGVRQPGLDGIVEVKEGNEFVPTGVSVWELGTDKQVSQKAEKDFKKRTESSLLGMDRSQLVFVFVTPRKWIGKNKWCEEKRRLGLWKDVRAYDASVLEEWLETSMATDIWFSKFIGRRPDGITGIEEHWSNLSALSNPKFKPEVFLASRDEDISVLKGWLKGVERPLLLEAHSPNEVIDFVSAYIANMPDDQRDAIEVRTVIVEDRSAWKFLCSSNSKFVLIPKPSLDLEPEMISGAVRQGHYVLLCLPRLSDQSSHKLSRVYHHDLEKSLIASGFNEMEANRLARESGGSLTILKRRLPGFASINSPVWSKSPEAESLLPILLIGGWDDSSTADQKAISVVGHSYAEVLRIANRYRTGNDPVLIRVHSSWSLISRDDSWELLSPKLSASQLDAFENIAFEILSENDPRYDLPLKERWYATFKNKISKYSDHLKEGIAETLVLLSTENVHIISVPFSPSYRAGRVIRKLLLGSDWKRWASLKDYLPLLAEASPEVFLEAVEKDLDSNKPQLPMLFIDEEDSFMSPCKHAGLLWALETLAWSSDYLSKATLLLARLAELQSTNNKWGNRPDSSLRTIFLPWLSQTTATADQRIIVLEKLINEAPQAGQKLLLDLLPEAHSSSSHTRRPSWRKWALGWTSVVMTSEYWKQVKWCGEKLIQSLGKEEGSWPEIIDRIEKLPKQSFDLLIEKLKTINPDEITKDVRQQIFNALLEKINRHRCFADAAWAMPDETLTLLESIKKKFEPVDLIQKHKWLFVGFPDLPEERQNFEKRMDVLFEKRLEVLKELFEKEGVARLFEFARVIEASYAMGIILGKSNLLKSDSHLLPEMITSKERNIENLAVGYAVGRFADIGWGWVDQLPLKEWSGEQLSSLLLTLPFDRKTWSMVESFGGSVSVRYWSACSSDFYRGRDSGDIEYAVCKLLKHERPFRAVNVISMALHNKCEIKPILIMETLEAALKLPQDGIKEKIGNHERYEIEEFFKMLQADRSVDQTRLAALEWAFLNLLDNHHGSTPKALHNSIQSDSKFFAELIELAFKSKNTIKKNRDAIPEQQQAKALNAYKLLTSFKSIPGIMDNGLIDEEKLSRWVTSARLLCQKSARLEVCDSTIGEMFAYSPVDDEDEGWPCRPVRDLIEKIKSDELDRGLQRGIYNKRGFHSKSMTEGGRQEYALAQQYAGYADKTALRWPRLATVLRDVASSYERDAQFEDEEVHAKLDL